MASSKDQDYVLDLKSVSLPEQQRTGHHAGHHGANGGLAGRKWLAIRWRCCQVYSRVYKSRDGKSYRGNCPKCGKPVNMKVGAGGTNCRFFEAG